VADITKKKKKNFFFLLQPAKKRKRVLISTDDEDSSTLIEVEAISDLEGSVGNTPLSGEVVESTVRAGEDSGESTMEDEVFEPTPSTSSVSHQETVISKGDTNTAKSNPITPSTSVTVRNSKLDSVRLYIQLLAHMPLNYPVRVDIKEE
jgi:hypothetical protein